MSENTVNIESGLFDSIPADDKEFYIQKALAYCIDNIDQEDLLSSRFNL